MKLRLCASLPADSENTDLCIRMLDTVTTLGLRGVEVKLGEDDIISKSMRGWLRETLTSYDLEVYAHLPYLHGEVNIASPSAVLASKAREIMLSSLGYASKLDCWLANTHLGVRRGTGPHIQRAARRLREIVRECSDLGVEIAVENQESRCNGVLNSPEDIRTLLSTYPDVQLTYDAGHGNTHGFGVEDFLPIVMPRLRYLHLHDNNGHWDEHLALGNGTLNLAYLMRELGRNQGLAGVMPVTLELRERDLEPSIRHLKQLDKNMEFL